jgi:hypothetical protein
VCKNRDKKDFPSFFLLCVYTCPRETRAQMIIIQYKGIKTVRTREKKRPFKIGETKKKEKERERGDMIK